MGGYTLTLTGLMEHVSSVDQLNVKETIMSDLLKSASTTTTKFLKGIGEGCAELGNILQLGTTKITNYAQVSLVSDDAVRPLREIIAIEDKTNDAIEDLGEAMIKRKELQDSGHVALAAQAVEAIKANPAFAKRYKNVVLNPFIPTVEEPTVEPEPKKEQQSVTQPKPKARRTRKKTTIDAEAKQEQ